MFGLIYSLNDKAAVGIMKKLEASVLCEDTREVNMSSSEFTSIKKCDFKGIKFLSMAYRGEVIYLDNLDRIEHIDLYIVPSRHESEAKIPSLTVHVTGNPWRRNDFGGKPMTLSMSNPVLMWLMLQNLQKIRDSTAALAHFSVSYEATHHGPTVESKPIIFIEIGSTEKEWSMAEAHEAVAKVILESIARYMYMGENSKSCIVSIGFGGGHYAPLFTKRALEKGECYGHIIPSYVIKELNVDDLKRVAEMAIEKTPGVKRIVIERMRSEYKNALIAIAKQYNIEYITIS